MSMYHTPLTIMLMLMMMPAPVTTIVSHFDLTMMATMMMAMLTRLTWSYGDIHETPKVAHTRGSSSKPKKV